MQQYLFRGKRKDNGEWVYGNIVRLIDKHYILEPDTKVEYFPLFIEVMPETVGMYTGMKDQNGRGIYEGDILKAFTPSVPCYEVFYCRSSYRLRYKLKSNEFYDWGPLFRMEEIMHEGRLKMFPEIIGNIHDNPELVKPALKEGVTNTMNNLDPNNAAGQQEAEQATEQVAAQESASQDQAMEVDGEEGGTEG